MGMAARNVRMNMALPGEGVDMLVKFRYNSLTVLQSAGYSSMYYVGVAFLSGHLSCSVRDSLPGLELMWELVKVTSWKCQRQLWFKLSSPPLLPLGVSLVNLESAESTLTLNQVLCSIGTGQGPPKCVNGQKVCLYVFGTP